MLGQTLTSFRQVVSDGWNSACASAGSFQGTGGHYGQYRWVDDDVVQYFALQLFFGARFWHEYVFVTSFDAVPPAFRFVMSQRNCATKNYPFFRNLEIDLGGGKVRHDKGGNSQQSVALSLSFEHRKWSISGAVCGRNGAHKGINWSCGRRASCKTRATFEFTKWAEVKKQSFFKIIFLSSLLGLLFTGQLCKLVWPKTIN